MFAQGCLNAGEDPGQDGRAERAVEEQDGRLRGQFKIDGIEANGLNLVAALTPAAVSLDVAEGDLMQFRGEFDADYTVERMFGGHKQNTPFARPIVDEDIVREVNR